MAKFITSSQMASIKNSSNLAVNPASNQVNIDLFPFGAVCRLSDFSKNLKALKVACIMDEFSYNSYQYECNLLQLTPKYWLQELELFSPELLFIESAWRGLDQLWLNTIGHTCQELQGIVAWCRERKVPTIFWNKEDPVHFTTFLNTAKLFDYVFTTDIDCIHRYKAALGHEKVYLLPFACQPSIHNPIEIYERKDAFCFAGSYYTRYPERIRDLKEMMIHLPRLFPVDIYDRNYGMTHPNYTFPPEYQPFIIGNLSFDQIDKAYKGYRYAINLNSIKQSQSMFARRVFELLASNTITVSNYSRGMRLLFGDLVISSDSGQEMARRLNKMVNNNSLARKLRLAALRKVMKEHTYEDRLIYIASKVLGSHMLNPLPHIAVTAYSNNQKQYDFVLRSYEIQAYTNKSLWVVTPRGFSFSNASVDCSVHVLSANELQNKTVSQVLRDIEWVACMTPDDFYGSNYLLDLALATRYCHASVIGKITQYVWSSSSGSELTLDGQQYRPASSALVRASIAKTSRIESLPICQWVTSQYTRRLEGNEIFGIDEFNYCRNRTGEVLPEEVAVMVSDLPEIDTGINSEELFTEAERIGPDESPGEIMCPFWNGDKLATIFPIPVKSGISTTLTDFGLFVKSTLPDGEPYYAYSKSLFSLSELGFDRRGKFHLNVTAGLNIQITVIFFDANQNRISHFIGQSNWNHEIDIPDGSIFVKLGIRIYASGSALIKMLVLGHKPESRSLRIIAHGKYLIVDSHYPSYHDLYKHVFVHSRVKAYKANSVKVDIFRMYPGSFFEFEGVDVISGSPEALDDLLARGSYKAVLVHFLDERMWEVLKIHIDRINIFVWVHGSEIQPWHRREFNYKTDNERNIAKMKSDARMAFWRGLLQPMPPNLKLVFVSRYSAEEVMEDLGFRLLEASYTVIHNPIDTELFRYEPKPPEQRKKILSIRPYSSATYANDLSVKAILALSCKPFFKELEFRMIGAGALFEETLAPIRKFDNVIIERGFLRQTEIAELHKSYGIFLCPSRMDTQGVSRDEAMSSGLVPVTNSIAAIPEFVDESCGILAGGEDAEALAEGIERLYSEPETFLRLSENTVRRVRQQRGQRMIVKAELELFK
ncbi:MAG: glycosyltransferase [Deltaproteobacteria bacterium]|nr:glycosyltransferase [Deltaproteobacteria bacterium]